MDLSPYLSALLVIASLLLTSTSASASANTRCAATTTCTQGRGRGILRVVAFSSSPGGGATAAAQFDRFRAECPAPAASVALFDPSLAKDVKNSKEDDAAFVAVYRSSNNLPSVIMRDDFLNSMRIATTVDPEGIETGAVTSKDGTSDDIEEGVGKGVAAQTPVAVARLRPSPDFPGSYVIDDMRCSLKKENTNEECDGGSEHTEALGVCIDELIMHRLRLVSKGDGAEAFFDGGAIRAKATLVSGPLLAERGFQEIDEFPLPADMCTHVSNLDSSMARYADRVVSAKNVGTRERALKILSMIGSIDREQERKAATMKKKEGESSNDDDGGDDYDPWANVKLPGQWT